MLFERFLLGFVLAVGCAEADSTNPSLGDTSSAICVPSSIGRIDSTGGLSTAREFPIAIALPSGRVLVAGGRGSSGALSSAEIYDPATGTFMATGTMTTPRVRASAVLLQNGSVLVTGGKNSSYNGIPSAEIYDPSTGQFSATGSMTNGRMMHTATVLSSGKVLVTGGYSDVPLDGPHRTLSSAELYDPSTGVFTQVSDMNAHRSRHFAAALAGGRALVGGGFSSLPVAGDSASAELFDPATNTFSMTGSMATGRRVAGSTTLLNGKILIVGGAQTLNGVTSYLAGSELYDPVAGSFSTTGNLNNGREMPTVVRLQTATGQALVIGGWGSSGGVRDAELYDPRSGTFSKLGKLSTGREAHGGVLIPSPDGRVLVAGGDTGPTGTTITASAEIFTPSCSF
jgi:hypothetical protein